MTLVAVLALPAAAAAETYVVNETGNVVPDVGCESPFGECDLWDAINKSNASTGVKDTIEFAVEEVAVNTALPQVTDPVTIDGTDTSGDPGVEIHDTGGSTGLELLTENSVVEGVALGGFFDGIDFKGSGNRICNSFLGTDLNGTVAVPNGVGIWIAPESVGTEVGGEACAQGGNIISGNEMMGVWDDAEGTTVAGNLIGVGVGNTELPNGTTPNPSLPAGGVYATGEDTTIGGLGEGEGNVIAYNKFSSVFAGGGGVISESFSVTIRANSIFENEGPGIFFRLIGGPPAPTLESVSSTEGASTVVSGTVFNEGTETFTVDLYANDICDEPEPGIFAGEGETYLGSTTATTTPTGGGGFTANLPVQPQGTVLTATATRQSSGATSEFSECLIAPAVTPKPSAPSGNPPVTFLLASPPPTPENGDSVVVAPKAGTVFVTVPGGKKVKLEAGQTIPVGSIVDATRGKVTLTSINKKGETQTAVFFGGIFLVQQQEGSGLVVLKLRGPLNCGKGGGSGKGNFRTEGNNGSATVRGTIWLTEDRCDGTFFKVRRGVVTIRDFGANETFPLGKGKSYLAQP